MLLLFTVLNGMKTFKRYQGIISNHTAEEEGTLVQRDDIPKEWTESVYQALSHNLVQN